MNALDQWVAQAQAAVAPAIAQTTAEIMEREKAKIRAELKKYFIIGGIGIGVLVALSFTYRAIRK